MNHQKPEQAVPMSPRRRAALMRATHERLECMERIRRETVRNACNPFSDAYLPSVGGSVGENEELI